MSYPNLRTWAEANEKDAEQVAADLTELLGEPIAKADVTRRWSGRTKKAWAEALGVELDEPPPRQRRRAAEDDAPPTPPLPDVNLAEIEARVAGVYVLVGKGVGAATRDARYAQVFEQHATQAGKAWAQLGREDPRVGRVLNALMVGGPWSGVIWTHLSIGMSLVMLSGRVQFPAFPGAPTPPPASAGGGAAGGAAAGEPAAAQAQANGHGGAAAEDVVGTAREETDFGVAPG